MSRFEDAVGLVRDLAGNYEDLASLADRIAKKLASSVMGTQIIGRVSVMEEIRPDRIPVDVPPQIWVTLSPRWPEILSSGYYLVVVDPKTLSLVLAVVEESIAASALASLHSGPPPSHISLEERSTPLQAIAYQMVSLRLWLRPLLLLHLGPIADRVSRAETIEEAIKAIMTRPIVSPTVPPDPNSPVAIPHPRVIEALIAAEHGPGVSIGALGIMDTVYTLGDTVVPLNLPWQTMVKHILVTGTTGSGKTSFVKNLLYNALRDKGVEAVVLDANGDYVASLLPGYVPGSLVDQRRALILTQVYGVSAAPGRPIAGHRLQGLIVAPCFRGNHGCSTEFREQCKRYRARIEAILSTMYRGLDCIIRVRDEEPRDDLVCKYVVNIEGCSEVIPPLKLELNVALRSIEVRGDARRLASMDPMLTERAREELRRIYTVYSRGHGEPQDIYAFIDWVEENRDALINKYRVHRETLNHILRRLQAIAAMGIVDTGGEDLDYGELASVAHRLGVRMIVLDLDYAATSAPAEADPRGVKVLLGSRLLQTLIRHVEMQRRSHQYTVLVIDEAHLFFPPRRGEEYSELLASWLERLARLGRARGIAMIFSTHREDDVSPLVSTLANTKIYFRTDEKTAEKLPIPPHYKKRLPYFADHAAIIASYAIRGGYATITAAPAIPGHRTA